LGIINIAFQIMDNSLLT